LVANTVIVFLMAAMTIIRFLLHTFLIKICGVYKGITM
jgi:hypothetical protein